MNKKWNNLNNVLHLRGIEFFGESNQNPFGNNNLPNKNDSVNVNHLEHLKNNLEDVFLFWKSEIEKVPIQPLVSLYYTRIIPKSRRIKAIIETDKQRNFQSIVGSKLTNTSTPKHIITHCISLKTIQNAIENLEKVIKILKSYFNSSISYSQIEEIHNDNFSDIFDNKNNKNTISKTKFVDIVVDSYFLENIGIEMASIEDKKDSVFVTLYKTDTKINDILRHLNISWYGNRVLDDTNILLNPESYNSLVTSAPYLISMSKADSFELDLNNKEDEQPLVNKNFYIPDPKNEPIIGVIDTLFDESVYFAKWVEFVNTLDSNISVSSKDYNHGTEVSSIIVDGPSINPWLEDGCGRFRVKHFGVTQSRKGSSFHIIKTIKKIVENNPEIKVWNLSLGSPHEINPNFISAEASILDKIQKENDVIFVISGTNKLDDKNKCEKIGAPADSINAIVVNSVNKNKEISSYSRKGPVLHFYNKPDISYYGGDADNPIYVCSPLGKLPREGTSYAAPWISRKLAFLIHILGLKKEQAKALIIDSATGWDNQTQKNIHFLGYGVVPIHINDIIKTKKDEIKFLLSTEINNYKTSNFQIPVPLVNNEFPFIAKITSCYFTHTTRTQGIDYANTEFDIQFGRIKIKDNKKGIKSIDNNLQNEEVKLNLYEQEVIKKYSKWNNLKHFTEFLFTKTHKKKQRKKQLGDSMWGIKITKKERLNNDDGIKTQVGIVITLKEIDGINRISEFIQNCKNQSWNVYPLDINVSNNIFIKQQDDLELI
ncbi:serine protease [Mycoplasma hyorhinis]|uniref:S8 family peptidase n=1 Tax=Mesomycoplasma hyorhinis TaxID=2100 RepID=UPI00136B3037|nr:S8 family peptidase [Mesomycoplasma hyorhinis]MXR07527.1 serine protease [Mesomycoplasma hyorhinis]